MPPSRRSVNLQSTPIAGPSTGGAGMGPEASFFGDGLPAPKSRTTRASVASRQAAQASAASPHSPNLSLDQIQHLRRQSNLSTLSLSPRRASGSTATTRPRRTSNLSKAPYGDTSYGGGSEAGFGEELGEGEGEGEEGEWTMVDRMRNWRNDSMTQHLYSSAEFWGGKVFALTGNPNDAFWLAQTNFLTHKYAQAERILTAPRPPNASGGTLNGGAGGSGPRRLTDTSLACRYLAAQCQVRLGKWEEALDMVGRGGILGTSEGEDEQGDGGIKLTASTAHLRGLIHLHLGATDLAKESFMEALSRDVKCFESFEMLVGSEMMSSEEEWEFIQGLQYRAHTGDDADFVRLMYTVRLRKTKHGEEIVTARQRLTTDFGLVDDPDVLASVADELYAALKFAECYAVTSKILSLHPAHRPTLPLHLCCMHHLPHLRSKLFLLAHELVENEPDDAISWYAVGMWYFSGRRWEESRRFFGKSVLIDSRFGPSWIAFAHSYAYEGEHDQAITAYSTALRHFQGAHLPLLFIGMQHLGLANVNLAHEYLEAAREGCPDDPLVMNEIGVVAVYNGEYLKAVSLFKRALVLAKSMQAAPTAWSVSHLNLGHAYRKLGQWEDAHASFRKVIELDPRSAGAYSALGLVEHRLGHFQDSIARYHEALSITPGDPVTCDLLKIVLEDYANSVSSGDFPFPGLPASAIRSIDQQVADLDRDIMAGVSIEDEFSAALAEVSRLEEESTMDLSG